MNDLAAETFALLAALAFKPYAATARDLERELGTDGLPVSRLCVLLRRGYADVDREQLWAITHAGFEYWAPRASEAAIGRALRLWEDARRETGRPCTCAECAA